MGPVYYSAAWLSTVAPFEAEAGKATPELAREVGRDRTDRSGLVG
jgi:hypothetical protein